MALEFIIPENIYDITFVYASLTHLIILIFFIWIIWKHAPKYHFQVTKSNIILTLFLFIILLFNHIRSTFEAIEIIQPVLLLIYFIGLPITFIAIFIFSVSLITIFNLIKSKKKFSMKNEQWKISVYGLILLNGITLGLIYFLLLIIWSLILSL